MVLSLEERLKISLLERSGAFEAQVEREIARTGTSGPGITHALEMFAYYARALARQVAQSWEDAPTPVLRVAALRSLNEHFRDRVEFFDGTFTRGHLPVPRALTSAVERECARMGFEKREAVVTIGPPGNYGTFVADLRQLLFANLQVDHQLPKRLNNSTLVLIRVPELEGTRAAWQPIVLGHELAHYFQSLRPTADVGLDAALDRGQLAVTNGHLPPMVAPGPTRVRSLEQVAFRWLNELICDAHAVHRYGAAGVAALVEFLESVGAAREISYSHPPALLRAELLFRWLGDALDETEEQILGALRELAGTVTNPDWAVYLEQVFLRLGPAIKAVVADWCGDQSYRARARKLVVDAVADRLADGIPGAVTVDVGGTQVETEPADVLNACWLAINRGTEKPVNRLALKALDTLDFLQHWQQAGGLVGAEGHGDASSLAGALTEQEINARLRSTGETRLLITPKLPDSVHGASVDLRLGNKFIVFERFSAAAFDALDPAQDPRSMQSPVERSWGDVFFLQPGQLVLASTLEYIVLPSDLTAQVITRSSYGRLGLISATAVQVHPHFAGCLTLELVNLGEMPMTITPGERIAQLMLFTTTSEAKPPEAKGDKYRYPTGPEFSQIRRDAESEVLRTLRNRFNERMNRRPLGD